jgi:3-oxoacyl-[acyl-carrier protein] reductase
MKYAFVTGGSRGIGRAICVELAQQGYHIIINYKSNDVEAEKTQSMVKEAGTDGILLKFDVSDAQAVSETLEPWLEENDDISIEVCVNNAGITRDNLMIFMENNEFDDVIKTNLHSFFYVTKLLIKQLVSSGKGRVINIASESGMHGLPGQVNYAAAKGGVIAGTKALALELGKKKVTVNAIAAGFIKTDMTADLDEKDYKKVIPLQRFGTPEEVAGVVGFLTTDKAAYITGQVISVNGGMFR